MASVSVVREIPPDRLTYRAITPTGRVYRWAEDAVLAQDSPADHRHSSVMPGGYDTFEISLPRDPSIDYGDLKRLTTVEIESAGGMEVGEYRLQEIPRASGGRLQVTPRAVGWKQHLEDDKGAAVIYVDRDLSHWQEPSVQRKLNLLGNGFSPQGTTVTPDTTTGSPSLETGLSGDFPATARGISEAWYDAVAARLGPIDFAWTRSSSINPALTEWYWTIQKSSDDVQSSILNSAGDLRAVGPGSGTVGGSGERWAVVQVYFDGSTGGEGQWAIFWVPVIYGNHGLTKQANGGLLESDIHGHAVETFAPLLRLADDSIETSNFEIPHLAFLEHPTTAGDIIRAANRYSLRDWAVWGKRTFYSHAQGARAKRWVARVGEAELDETGPSMKQIWNGVYVSYQDVDGSTRLVGPTGSLATETSDLLLDEDPENPANEMNMRLWDLLQAGITTHAGATELGRRFLEGAKQLDLSGRATLRGYVESASGNLHPASVIRAGDEISFLGASDQSYRRIVRADYSRADRSCGVDLDAPPEGLESLLARLEVSLVRLGL